MSSDRICTDSTELWTCGSDARDNKILLNLHIVYLSTSVTLQTIRLFLILGTSETSEF